MAGKPNQTVSGQTRRAFLAATGASAAVALAGCSGGSDSDESGGYERVSESYGEQGGALNEGRLDVGVGTMMNFTITPGWLQETMASVDDFRVLGVSDDTASAWDDEDSLLIQDLDTTKMEGADNDNVDVPGDLASPTFAYNFVGDAALDYDTVKTFLETMWEVRDALADEFGIFAFHKDPEFWVKNSYDGIPFHPAAADFYEEQGVWSDEFERADEPSESLQPDTIRMKTSTQSTTAYAGTQAIASVLNDNLSDLTMEAQTSDGTEENLGDIASGDIEMGYLQNWTAREYRQGVEPFDQLDVELVQFFHYYDLPWFFITNNMDLETLSDIESGMTVSPTPSGSGTAPGLERALELALE